MPRSDIKPELVKVLADGYRCYRCDHEWIPRGKDPAKVCPKCKSPYWYIPRKEKVG